MNNKKNTRSVKKLSMNDAAAFIFSMGVKSYSQYVNLCANGQRPSFLPSNLTTYYAEYPGWEEFMRIGQEVSKSTLPTFGIDYYELKHLLKIKNISTVSAYQKARKNNELPIGTPANPETFYPQFEGWDLFLPDQKLKITYEEAKKIIHPFNLRSGYQWRNFCRDGHKPDGIPVLPDRDYPDFVSWADFLGFEEK